MELRSSGVKLGELKVQKSQISNDHDKSFARLLVIYGKAARLMNIVYDHVIVQYAMAAYFLRFSFSVLLSEISKLFLCFPLISAFSALFGYLTTTSSLFTKSPVYIPTSCFVGGLLSLHSWPAYPCMVCVPGIPHA